jgi:capsular exopolysaccharide synthesis family protein
MDPLKPSGQQEAKLHFLDYWRIIRIRKTVILAVFLLVVITATLVTYILPEQFASTARIKVERDNPDITGFDPQSYQRGAFDPYFIQTEFEVLQSEVILNPVIATLDLNEKWGKKYNNGVPLKTTETMDSLKRLMSLRPVRNASIIEIQVSSDKPDEAALIANTIAETYRNHRLQVTIDLMRSGIDALEKHKEDFDKKVAQQQKVVDDLRTSLGINDADPGSVTPTPTLSVDVVKNLQNSQEFLTDIQVHLETQLTNLLKLDKSQVREAIQTAIEQPDTQLTTLLNEYDLAEQRRLLADKDFTTNHPTYISAERAIQDLDEKIDQRVNGILLGLQNRIDATHARLNQLSQRLENARATDLAMAQKSRPYYDAKQKLAEMMQFRQILGMKLASTETEVQLPHNSIVTITDHAEPSPIAVKPKKTLNIILGVVIGLVVGVGLAFFIEYLDTSVKTIDDVERTLQAPVLGVIPQNVGFLLEEGAESPHAEAYRVLRTNLLFSRKDDKLNTIAVVSAGAGEGKSTTVMNLATVFAQNGSRVVVVDSDLRRPTLHKMLRVTNSIGLTNYLLKQNSLEEVIQTTSLPSLDFMASGKLPSSSMGVLSSTQMRNLINELKQRYDYVFFDSPPIMGVSDASILASEVDLTLQVIQYRRYPQPMNIRAKQMIEKVGGNLMGIVLNNINMSQDESYYYYSGYYHEYYSKNGDDDAVAQPESEKSRLDIKPKY